MTSRFIYSKDGREIHGEDKELPDDVANYLGKDVAAAINGMKCPVHGNSPVIKFEVVGKQLEASLQCCCEEFADEVQGIIDSIRGDEV